MSPLISELFDVLIASTVAYVLHRILGTPLLEVATFMTFSYVVILNARSRNS